VCKRESLKTKQSQFIGAANADTVVSNPKQRKLHEYTHTRHTVLPPVMVTESKQISLGQLYCKLM